MSTYLADLFDPADLERHVTAGNIRQQAHPTRPLWIYNYTEQAVYTGAWDEVTLTCRGLVVRADGQVVARPFAKFFNYGQPGAPDLDLDGPVTVTDKADGSLGILYPADDAWWAVATRGSFTSDQAIHATRIFTERYRHRWAPEPGVTYLFEIVYPGNRIVVDYGDLDDLLLLGAVDIATGRTFPPDPALHDWPGPAVDIFDHRTLADALAAPPRPNAEGLVVHCRRTDQRVKIKQDDYVALHRIVTGLNARTVWRHLCDGQPLDDLIVPLPDEFHPWVHQVAAQLYRRVSGRRDAIYGAYNRIASGLPDGWTRKDFAMEAVQHPDKAYLFALLDGKDPTPGLWRDAKPPADWTPTGRTFTEDAA